MFDMSGHKIEITGLRPMNPREEQVLKDEGIDISPYGQVRKCLEKVETYARLIESNELSWQHIRMVVWGEDLAKVPLLVYTDEGLIWANDMLTDEHRMDLSHAAVAINGVIEAENS